jgi:transposase-like protein
MTDKQAREYLENLRWPNGVICPECNSGEHVKVRIDGRYRCRNCEEYFTVRTATVLERSHVPLRLWVGAVDYLLEEPEPAVSDLARALGIHYYSAQYMMERLEEAWPQ